MTDNGTPAGSDDGRPRSAAVVRFDDPGEFLAELARDSTAVLRGIVRVTCEYRRPDWEMPYRELSVLAGYEVAAGDDSLQLIELRHPCGLVWGLAHDRDTTDRAEQTIGLIEQATADAGLEHRPGKLVAAPPQPATEHATSATSVAPRAEAVGAVAERIGLSLLRWARLLDNDDQVIGEPGTVEMFAESLEHSSIPEACETIAAARASQQLGQRQS